MNGLDQKKLKDKEGKPLNLKELQNKVYRDLVNNQNQDE